MSNKPSTGQEARSIFVRSGLPGVTLNAIWMLADTRGSGSLNKTEFIIAMHYLSRLMSDPTLTLPQTLPSQTYVEATGSFASSIRRNNIMTSPAISNKHIITTPLMSHMTASTTSLDDTVGSLHNSSINQVVLTESEVKKYEVYFNQLDTDNSGFIEADEAVYFFSHSRLPDSELGFIWEIADSKRIGKLDLHDFAVAMHLIGMRKNNQSIDHCKLIEYFAHVHKLTIASIDTQQNTQNQSFSNLLDQHQNTDLLTQRYELESQLVEIKQQTISQQRLINALAPQLEETKAAIFDLQSEISAAKNESMITRNAAEKAEKEVELLKQKRDRLSSHGMGSPSRAFISSLPELTRTSSTLSGSTVLSPRSEQNTVQSLFDPFNTIKSPATTTTTIKMPLSPIQAKAVSKYGFDITMFDTLTVSENNRHAPTSVNDDLATLFNPPATLTNDKKVASHNFDSVFM